MTACNRHTAVHLGRLLAWALAMVWLTPCTGTGVAFAQTSLDSDAVLERLIHYVRWPSEATTQKPWQLCVVGDAKATRQHFQGMSARNRKILVVSPDDIAAISRCHLLDLRQVDAANVQPWLDAAYGKPILTLGSDASFCSRGGHVCYREEQRSTFGINLSLAQAAGFRINARLLAPESEKTP